MSISGYEIFGKFIYEASKQFSFVKVSSTNNVLGEDTITMQFVIMKGGKVMQHSEQLSLTAISKLDDPVTVVKAIHNRAVANSIAETKYGTHA